MRSFIIALIILSSIITLTVCNTLYVTKKTDMMLNICENLKNNNSANTAEQLLAAWQNCQNIISLSTHRNDLERAEDAIYWVTNSQNVPEDFYSQIDILISAFEHLRASHSFNFENIF